MKVNNVETIEYTHTPRHPECSNSNSAARVAAVNSAGNADLSKRVTEKRAT
jgi:hypothetical protein